MAVKPVKALFIAGAQGDILYEIKIDPAQPTHAIAKIIQNHIKTKVC